MSLLGQETTALPILNERELAQVATLWKRTSRELVTRFIGSSMNPTIPSESEVVLRCGSAVRDGDIVAYCRGDQLIVHRVVVLSRDGRWLIARGDALLTPDPALVPVESLVGTIVAVKREGAFAEPGPSPRSRPIALILDGVCRALVRSSLPRSVVQRCLLGLTYLKRRFS